MRKSIRKLFYLLFLVLCTVVITTCKKLEKEMLVSTGEVTDISTNSAGISGIVIDLGEGITQHGHCYAKTPNVSINSSKTELGVPPGTGGFTSQLTNLEAGTTYYIKAYISNGIVTAFGKEISFETIAATCPVITTSQVTSITTTAATCGGNITIDGGASVTARGVCWNTASNPTISNSKTIDESGSGAFTSNLEGLTPGNTYYVRAYATNSVGTAYGNEVEFKTNATVPVLSTAAVTNITTTTAKSGGNITSDGGASVSARGTCWSKTANPTIADNKTSDGTGSGNFESTLTGLTASTIYYVRTYAKNSIGTAYGNELSFSTGAVINATLSTAAITSITTTTATSGGTIDNDGGAHVTARGVCWKTSSGSTIADSKTSDGDGSGSFASNLTGLAAGTTYYVRAYATNSIGTAYGKEISFTTSIVVPTIATSSITYVTVASAVSGGNITDNGGASVTARGVCWNTFSSPTIVDSKTSEGTGSGTFVSTITGLASSTTYYVRAYATNSAGTSYGNELIFTTNALSVATLSTNAITSITTTSAVSGGNITSDGGSEVTARGICWSTSANPTIADTKTTDGSGTGSFISNLTGLSASTKYYVRAYATNSFGTSYGNELSFTANSLTLATMSTTAITSITTSGATCGGNINYDGGSEVIARGICWNTAANPTTANFKTTDGSGIGSFISNLTGLITSTKYYVRAYAINSIGTAYGDELSFMTTGPTVTDIDGNVYNIVTIGTQVWIRENLKVTKYRDGTTIPNLTDGLVWASAKSGAYCYYNNDINYKSLYGLLYNWYTVVDNHNLCPIGWHVPTNSEWTTLVSNLGGSSTAGGKLKSTSSFWSSPNTGATDESGFSGLPAGMREITVDGPFYNVGYTTAWWSSTEGGSGTAAYRLGIDNTSQTSTQYMTQQRLGYSVRCLQGEGSVSPVVTTGTVSSITTTTATCGGNVTSDGGSVVTAKGVCWNTSANPTTTNSKSVNGSGTGTFTHNLFGLTSETKYYVRAYATNSVTTVYGDEISFTTAAPSLPTLSTLSISDITQNGAKSGGNITNDGGGSLTARGVCWSTAANPTIADNKTSDGTGSGSFISTMTGLSIGSTYYVRAYATNSSGTGYGNELSFTISATCVGFQVTHTAGVVAPVAKTVTYGTVKTDLSGMSKCWITQNLGADNQASSAIDDTEAAAGWYWQFNRKQGYKHDGSVRTPNTTWISSISETSDWLSANDPCTILLGTGWRIPTQTEWINADINGGWTNYNDVYASVLRLHAGGVINYIDGSLIGRGSGGFVSVWSTKNAYTEYGVSFGSTSAQSDTGNYNKAYGHSLRCLKD